MSNEDTLPTLHSSLITDHLAITHHPGALKQHERNA